MSLSFTSNLHYPNIIKHFFTNFISSLVRLPAPRSLNPRPVPSIPVLIICNNINMTVMIYFFSWIKTPLKSQFSDAWKHTCLKYDANHAQYRGLVWAHEKWLGARCLGAWKNGHWNAVKTRFIVPNPHELLAFVVFFGNKISWNLQNLGVKRPFESMPFSSG